MAASGNPYDGPKACPFVALELDRDRRSERPDYRHRCFAEPTPAPRSIAHQEAYCLSPGFAACPIFQDWAVRAAARPAGAGDVPATASVAGAAAAGGMEPAASEEGTPAIEDELPPLAAYTASEPASATGPIPPAAPHSAPPEEPLSAWDSVGEPEQLGAFDAPATAATLPGAFTAPEPEPETSWGEPDAGYQEPPAVPGPPGYVPPPARRDTAAAPSAEEPAVPAFLAGRAALHQSPPDPSSGARPAERVKREEIVPSWAIDGRYGAEAAPDDRGGGRFDSLLTAVAVIIILGLGIAGVMFLPGLLAGTPSRTPGPSFVVPSTLPSAAPTAVASREPTPAPASVAPTDAAATASAGPEGSPREYSIRRGDTLAKIAKRFNITVEELLAANPQITDPNRILVGQVLVIPPPSGS